MDLDHETNLKDSQFTDTKTEKPSQPTLPALQCEHPSRAPVRSPFTFTCKEWSVTYGPGKLGLLIPAIAQGARIPHRSLPFATQILHYANTDHCNSVLGDGIKETITQLTPVLSFTF